MNVGFNYDKVIKNVGVKYKVPILAAKRAEVIKNNEELEKQEDTPNNKNYVNEAFKEIEENKIKPKDSKI